MVLIVIGWSWNWTRVLSADLSNITKPSNPTLIWGLLSYMQESHYSYRARFI